MATLKDLDEPILLTITAIEPMKGLDILVKAVSMVNRKMKVLIIGQIRDNDFMLYLKSMIKKLKLEDKINFIGWIDNDKLDTYYKSATLFVHPSRDESLGVVILEALTCGLPVIATSVGGIPDMISQGKNGILVPPNNPKELANAISLLLDNKALRMEFSLNAKQILYRDYYRNRITLKEAFYQSMKELELEK